MCSPHNNCFAVHLLPLAAVALMVFAASSANAQLYLEARGAATRVPDTDIDRPGSAQIGKEVDFETGFLASAAVGYAFSDVTDFRWLDQVRLEVEGFFQKVSFDSVAGEPAAPAPTLSGSGGGFTNWGGLVSVLYDLPVGDRLGGVSPYVGGGLGGSDFDVDGGEPNQPDGEDDSEVLFLYQIRAGATYKIADRWALNVGYRYLASPTDVQLKARQTEPFKIEYRSHNFEVGIRFKF